MLKKLFSLTIAVFLTLSSFPTHGFSASPLLNVFNVEAINAYAFVTEASFKNSSVSIFNIQDLHFNIDSQKKIFALLENLHESYPDFELYVEGASENSDFEWVYSSLGKKSGNVFIEALFDSGNISGAEYFSAKYGKRINSVEDKGIFDGNLLLFAELIEQRPSIENLLIPLEKNLENLRNKYFMSEQQRLFSAYKRYRSGSLQESEYFDFLKKESIKKGIDINDYPNIALYVLTNGSAAGLSQRKLQSQMSELFSNLKNVLSYKQYSELIAVSNNLKDRQSLIAYLYKNREEISLDHYPQLNKFITSIALSDKINRLEFINEENILADDLSVKIYPDENSKNILFMSRFIDIYRNVLMTSAAADEYQYYKDNISKFKALLFQYAVGSGSFVRLNSIEAKAVEFNDKNLKRNEIFISKMLGDTEHPSGIYPDSHFGVEANAKAIFESSASSKIKVIVAGGFHTAGINDILNKKRINNITFMPRITSAGHENSQKYVEYARMLYSAGDAAIPLPVYNELTMEELSLRVLDTISKEHINKGFDLSSPALKQDIEKFLLAKEGLEEAEFSYDKESNEMLIRYKEKGSSIFHPVRLSPSDDKTENSTGTLTTLGDITPGMVREILKGATFNVTDIIPNIFIKMVRETDYYRERYNGSDIEQLRLDISSGKFDYKRFFTNFPLKLNTFVIKMLSSFININTQYPDIYEKLRETASTLLSYYDEVDIRIVDSSFLINEEGWSLAALNTSVPKNGKKSAILYVHSEFLEALKYELSGNSDELDNVLKELIMHEVMENNALYSESSIEYQNFGNYLRKKGIGEEGRTTKCFHDFIKSELPDFGIMIKMLENTNSITLKGQKDLLKLGNSIRLEAFSRHEEIQSIYKIDSLRNRDIDKEIQHDLLMLRIGDNAVIEKYANKIADYIKKNILNGDADGTFSIAVRFTEPMHITQKLGSLVSEKTGLKIININQDDYMDYIPMIGQVARENIANKFDIEKEAAFNVENKKIIILEDITKTGFVFGQMSKPLNKAHASSIIPLTIFDIRDALAPKKIKGVQAHTPIDELFNINDYLKRYMAENPEDIAKKIIELKGNTTKYFYYALSELMKENNAAFGIIVKRLYESDAEQARLALIEDMSLMHLKYPSISSNMIPLIFFIENNLTTEELRKKGNVSTEYFEHYRGDEFEDSKGILEMTSDDLGKWGEFQWLIPLYCRLHGFTKVHIKMQEDAKIRTSQNNLMLDVAQQLNINILYQYQSEEIPKIEDNKLREDIRKAIKDKKLEEAVKEARETFRKAILNNVENGSMEYKDTIKEVMKKVNEIVREIIKFDLSPDSYSIVVGGSLVNGSVTPSSDIYYDVIARDKAVVAPIRDKFLPAYQYALECTGLVPLVSNGMKVDFPGSIESSLITTLDAAIYDERSIATFFDFEPVYDANSSDAADAFMKYQEHVFKILMEKTRDKETLESRRNILKIMGEGIASVSKPYYRIIERGFYFIQKADSKSAKRTFFGNLYAAAYSNSIYKSYDYRWVIRGLEVALKEILLKNAGKIDSLKELPRDKEKLIMYMFDKGMFVKDFKAEDAKKLQQHMRVLIKCRQEKVAKVLEYHWTDMSDPEISAIGAIHAFIIANTPKKVSDFPIKEENIVAAYVVERYTPKQLEKVRYKINRYEEWAAGKNSTGKMLIALLLSEFPQSELIKKDGILAQLGLRNSEMISNIDMIFSIRKFPSIDKISGDFGIQNYMDAILKRAGKVDRVYAAFADKVSNFIFHDYFEQFFSIHKAEEFLDYNKLADYYMKKNQDRLNEELKNLPADKLKNLFLKEYQQTTKAEMEKRLMTDGLSELLDKSKVAMSLKNGMLESLSSNESLKAMIADKSITDLFTEEGVRTVEYEIDLAKNLEKLLIYLIYVPLARRINDINLFESIRNLLFYETQPELYIKILSILEKHIATELRYSDYGKMLDDLKEKLVPALEEKARVKKYEVHTRVKSLYSIFEKIVSSRRGEEKQVDLNSENIGEKIKEKIKDIYGFHIVVDDSSERKKAMDAVESAFIQSKVNGKYFYTLKKNEKGEIDRIFNYDIEKGFARVKYTYEINGTAAGEIIIYSKEEYENEHNGLITRADPDVNETNALVKKSKRSFILTFPLAHWIYKMGERLINNKYADSTFNMELTYNQLFYGEEEALADIKKIMGDSSFYFYSDDIIFDDNTEDTLRKMLNTKIKDKIAYFVTMPNGSSYPLMLSSLYEYSYYEILASAGLDAERDYILTDMDGNEVKRKRSERKGREIPLFVKLVKKEGENPFSDELDIERFMSLRAKVLASLRGQPLGEIKPSENFLKLFQEEGQTEPSELSQEDWESIEIYSNSLGLKSIEELYYAEINGLIDEEQKSQLIDFVNKRKDTVFEIRKKLSVEDGGKQITITASDAESEVREILKNFGQSVYAQADADKGEVVYKIIYSGNSDKVQDMIDAFKEKGFSVITFKDEQNRNISFQRRRVYLNIQALGRNIAALVGEISTSTDYAVLAANALIAMFSNSKVNKMIDGLFYDENSLIMKIEVSELLSLVQSLLASVDSKYENYDFDLQISSNENLIKDSDTYAFASLSEDDGRVTLYINETFLRAIENLEDKERLFYLRQLAIHEGMERASFLKGEMDSYEEFHKSLSQLNPDQAKLMEFVAKIAKDEMEKRDKEQLTGEIASKLSASQELTEDNPADFILILGNDEISTFEKALELYDGGLVKEIVVSGGVGRLTLPLIKKAVEMGIGIPLSNGTVISSMKQYEELGNFSETELRQLTTEADIIKLILLNIAAKRGMDIKQIKILKEERSTNTMENFDNDVIKNLIEEIKVKKGGKAVRAAYIQTPVQQLRAQATFNSVFRDKIINGEIEGISVTVSDFYERMSVEDIVRQSAAEILRLIIYSLKGDAIPAINDSGLIFDGVIGADILIKITALLENLENKPVLRKNLFNIISNTKDSNGNTLFPDKKSIIDALDGKVAADSYQFEAMKIFLDFVYYDIERNKIYKHSAVESSKAARVLSKMPFVIQEKAVDAVDVAPQYLKDEDRVFIFDIENAASNAALIAYMGSYGTKAFSIMPVEYINSDNVLFDFQINTGARDIVVKAALVKVKTENGIFYNLQYSLPFIYEMPSDKINKEAKEQLLKGIFENLEIMQKLKAEGLDLSKSKNLLFVNRLPDNRTLTTVNAAAQRIAESTGLDSEMRKVESKSEKKGIYNEKLHVSAMLRSSGDSGIGEITLLQNYAETVLKPAGVNGFTMNDIFSVDNPLAANYLLLDWMSVPEAQGIITAEDLAVDISERDTINKERTAKRKNLVAMKVYTKLSAEQRSEVEAYYMANTSWLDAFAASEKAKYNIDIDDAMFIRIMALQQMLFELQLKQTLLKMADMNISMYVKEINADNAEIIISKWIARGITSFTVEIDSIDAEVLNNIAKAAAESGFFINVFVKSANMTSKSAKIVADMGYTPVIQFQNVSQYENISGYKVEINDKTFETHSSVEELLKNSAQSGALSVDYPIGLLWGEIVSEDSAQNYRIPPKGSKRFEGLKLGWFKIGQKTFEESYAGSYINAVETGLNTDILQTTFDINAVNVKINGQSLPAVYAAALIGSLAKQNRLSEIKDFKEVTISLIDALGTKENLKIAGPYLDKLLLNYNSSEGEQKEINAAKIAGFIQGLSENIIINGRNGKFTSKAVAKVFASLMAEASLFKAGYYPSAYAQDLPAEMLLGKVQDILKKYTFAAASAEIEPILLNLSIPIQKMGFTFDISKTGELVQSKDKSEKVYKAYTDITNYMLDIFIDKIVTKEQIRRSTRTSSLEAIKDIMSAA
ncbi:MAG: hypothetical protein LBD46_04175 [Endomicrobium sp.]|jgi:hypothetical protein|nr:hypothetical protein [Endomicrobium sp.]